MKIRWIVLILLALIVLFLSLPPKEDIEPEKKPLQQKQSYPHYKTGNITWAIVNESRCWKGELERIKKAFSIIEEETDGLVQFQQIIYDPQIMINCFDRWEDYYGENYTWKSDDSFYGEAIINDWDGDLILQSEVTFVRDSVRGSPYISHTSCSSGFPLTEIHEILHALGFGHSEIETDVLYPYRICLKQTQLNQHYSDCLKYIYSDGEAGYCNEEVFI